jgi:hypothetical protein
MFRTAEQDERLQQLYEEREQILDYAFEHNEDVSIVLNDVDAEIELLTADLDVEPTSPNDMSAEEQAEWFAGAEMVEFET